MSSTTIFEPLDSAIQNQLEIRQDIMANKITNQNPRMAYLNKACNVRLIPLVKDTSGDTNYKNFVFSNFTLKNGFFNTFSSFQDKNEKPYIDDFEVLTRSGNNIGATKIGNLTIVVPTKNQFNLIERYFRIGTPFLLEWGWGKYADTLTSSRDLQFIDERDILKDSLNESDIEQQIINLKKSNHGNYEGGIFYITNFTTSIKNSDVDFYFELNISLVSKGDILNSLTPVTNSPISDSSVDDNNVDNLVKNDPIISFLKGLSTSNIAVDKFSQITDNTRQGERPNNPVVLKIEEEDYLIIKASVLTQYIDRGSIIRGELTRMILPGTSTNPISTLTTTSKQLSYIKLGAFLDNLSRIYESSSTFGRRFDRDFSKNRIYILSNYPLSKGPNESFTWDSKKHFASFNPYKFILPHFDILETTKSQKIDDILIRVDFLIEEISKLIKEGKNDLNNILKIILKTINDWTDDELGLIKYENEDNNLYEIVSSKDEDNFGNLFKLKLYGLGSIAESTEIDTVIDNKISSQVAIMMNGSSNFKADSNAISLLKFNKNIRSRFNTSFPDPSNPSFISSVSYKTILEKIENDLKTFHLFGKSNDRGNTVSYKDGMTDDAPFVELLNLYKRLKQEYISFLTTNNRLDQIRGTPLFPIKIRTTLPGISGIRIGNKLKIEDIRLPEIYTEDNVYYIVSNVQNKVTNRYWNTFLDLSPQLNTRIISSDDIINARPPIRPEIDIEKLLETILYLQTGKRGIQFNENGTFNNQTKIGTNLRAYINNDGNNTENIGFPRFRGPYGITPVKYSRFANNNLIKKSQITQNITWGDIFVENVEFSPDIPSKAKELTKRYFNTFSLLENSIERTYPRLLILWYFDDFQYFRNPDRIPERDKNKLTNYINEGTQYLYNQLGLSLAVDILNDEKLKKILPFLLNYTIRA